MSDPVPLTLKPRPRRAAPILPDQPWQSKEAEPTSPTSTDSDPAALALKGTPDDPASVKRQKEQADVALSNVREGYD